MGKVAVLDRIRNSTEALFEKDTADMRARYPELPAADEIEASKLFGILDSD